MMLETPTFVHKEDSYMYIQPSAVFWPKNVCRKFWDTYQHESFTEPLPLGPAVEAYTMKHSLDWKCTSKRRWES